MAKYELKDERILDVLPKIHVDPNDEFIETHTLRGSWSVHPDLIWKPEALVALEAFPAGKVTKYTFWHNEVQYIVSGRAEIRYVLPITRYSVQKSMKVVPGDAYVIPCGADVEFDVAPEGPLVRFCVAMPGPARYRPDLMPPSARWPGMMPEGKE